MHSIELTYTWFRDYASIRSVTGGLEKLNITMQPVRFSVTTEERRVQYLPSSGLYNITTIKITYQKKTTLKYSTQFSYVGVIVVILLLHPVHGLKIN